MAKSNKNDRSPTITNVEKLQLFKWLITKQEELHDLTISQIAQKASKQLQISCKDPTVKRTIDDGGIDIRYKHAGQGGTIAVAFRRIKQLEAAYMKLCKEVGTVPDPLVMKENQQNPLEEQE